MGVNGNCILRGLYQLQLVATYYTPRALGKAGALRARAPHVPPA